MCVTQYLSDPGSTLFYFSLVVWWQIRGDRFYGVRGQMHSFNWSQQLINIGNNSLTYFSSHYLQQSLDISFVTK